MKSFFSDYLISCFLLLFFVQINCAQSNTGNETRQALQLEQEAETYHLNWNRDSYVRSRMLYLEAAEIRRFSGNSERRAFCLREAGELSLILGEKQTALKNFEDSLKSVSAFAFSDEKFKTLAALSLYYLESGDAEKSKNLIVNLLSLTGKINNNETLAVINFTAAENFYYQRENGKAIEFYEKAIDFWRKDSNLRGEAKGLLYLGYSYLYTSEYLSGLEKLEGALSKWKAVNDKRGEAFTQIAIGHIFSTIDEKQKALDRYKIAESLFPANLDFIDKARMLNGIGSVLENYGDWRTSIKYRENALEHFKNGSHLHGQLATLSNLGYLYSLINENEKAFALYQESQGLAENLKDNYYLSVIKQDLGLLLYNGNSFEKALTKYREALIPLQKINSPRLLSTNYERTARVYLKMNDLSQAQKYFQTSLDLNRKVKDRFAESQTLYHLSKLKLTEKKVEDAASLIERSIRITEELSTDVYNTNLKSTYFSNVFDRYELYINLLMEKNKETSNVNYALQALQAAERSRARSMLETLRMSEAKFNADADPELVRREREILALLNNKADKLTEVLSENAAPEEIKKIEDEINALKNELEEVKANFKQNSPLYSEIKNPEPFDVIKFQNQVLDENTALLEFSLGKDASYLWLVGKNDFDVYELPPQGIIEPKIRRLLELLTEREMRDGEDLEVYQARLKSAEVDYNLKAKDLSRELLGAVSGKIQNKRLLVVADGILNYFPLSALPAPDSDELLIAKNEIVYQPSASTISFLRARERKNPASKDVLVFADAIFSPNDARITTAEKGGVEMAMNTLKDVFRASRQFESVKNLPRLSASQKEAEAISEIFGASRSLIVSGADARRERVLQADLADYRIVHFATHGLLNEEHPEFSSIVFSLYDEKGEPLKGFLRLQDIYKLNLNSDLIVLSACDSAIGKEIKGEGVVSLTRGFMQAGSKSVLSSLWKVEDNAAAELMRSFYDKFSNENVAPSEALRRAQLEMSKNPRYASPFYWAAFTLQGEYAYEIAKPSYFSKYSYFIGLAVVLILGFGGILIYRRFYRRGY